MKPRFTRLLLIRKKAVCTVLAAVLSVLLLSMSAFATPGYDCAAELHNYVEIEHVPATADTDGYFRYRCLLCQREYTDVEFATDHVWGPWIIDEPTCTEPGERHRTCSRGMTHVQSEQIPALKHDYQEVVAKQPSCETEGEIVATCSRCGDSYTRLMAAIGHEYRSSVTKQQSCMEDGLVTYVCIFNPLHTYTEPIPAYGAHDFGQWYVETPAGEGIAGVEARVCLRDGYKETREISALSVKPAPSYNPSYEPSSTFTPAPAPAPSSNPSTAPTPDSDSATGPLFNEADVVIEGVNAGLLTTFSFLLHPYFKWALYIRRRRKVVLEENELREMVAQKYDFK